MKKALAFLGLAAALCLQAQESANRFFYELTFKPKKEQAFKDKVMTVLEITKEKSIYRDFTTASQDSILKKEVEEMQRAGVFKDLSKSLKMPKFSYKVYKFYPSMKIQYVERLMNGMTPTNLGYNEDLKLNWKVEPEKQKIGEYNAQKATTDFGGRHWTAWFTTDLPFQDGPYKFYGLPGLIVKIEDDGGNYSWELKGNKNVPNYSEITYAETIMPGGAGGKVVEVSREKFDQTFNDYKADPFASIRPYLTPQMMSQQMPGSDQTIGDMVKSQEKMMKDFYAANDNPVEIPPAKNKKK